jgi:DNA-binding SARP family transcriptional activator/TolB-like protein
MTVLRLLGSVNLKDAGGKEIRPLLRQPKRLAVLAYLAGNSPEIFHRRDRLLALFWPESTTEQARHGLRQVLYELKRQLGDDVLVRRGAEDIGLNWDVVTCDVAQFYAALAEGQLDRAMELYRGDFLDAFFISGAPEFMQWMDLRRAEILRSAVDASWQLADQHSAQGDLRSAAAAAQHAVDWSPTDEAGARRLISLLHDGGNGGEAFRVYDRLVRSLADEFEATPSVETNALIARVREDGGGVEVGPETIPAVRTAADPVPAQEESADNPWSHPVAVGALFGLASVGVLGFVWVLMLRLGLPDWVLGAAIMLLLVGLPIMVATAVFERQHIADFDRPRPRWLTWNRTVPGGGMAFSSLAMFTAGFMGLRAMGIGPAATLLTVGALAPSDQILLADFANRSDDPTLAATLTELLRIDFSQSRTVRLVDAATVRTAMQRMALEPGTALDEGRALEVAEREAVRAVLVGEVAQAGSGYVLSAKLIAPPDGALLAAERVTADDETELIAAIDRLSAKVRERVGESLRDVRASPPLAQVTTSSLAALRKYTQATSGLVPGGVPGMQLLTEAVALDTTFAMAYRRLSIRLAQLGEAEASRDAIRRAFQFSDRLPEIERDLIAGSYYLRVEYDPAKIEAAFLSALAIDPDNQIALINLASHRSRARRWEEREALASRSLALRWTGIAFAYVFTAQLLQGKFGEARSTLERLAIEGSGPSSGRQFDLDVAQRDYDAAERALEAGGRPLQRRGLLMRLRGRLVEAEQVFAGGRTNRPGAPNPNFLSSYRRATLQADHGSIAEAMLLLDPFVGDSILPRDRHFLERAELAASVGRVDEARALVADFEATVDSAARRNPEIVRDVQRVSGEIALSEGRFHDAITAFGEVNDLSVACTTCGLARLAQAWLGAGQPDSALAVYERILSTQIAGLSDDDARWLPETHRQLGELYAARGDTAKAIGFYRQFVWFWKDADPQLQPQVSDARRQIERLLGSS